MVLLEIHLQPKVLRKSMSLMDETKPKESKSTTTTDDTTKQGQQPDSRTSSKFLPSYFEEINEIEKKNGVKQHQLPIIEFEYNVY